MARIWQEGFESGLPHGNYLEGTLQTSQHIKGLAYSSPTAIFVNYYRDTGRTAQSQFCAKLYANQYFLKVLDSTITEGYLRVYFKFTSSTNDNFRECIGLKDQSGNFLLSLYQTTTRTSFSIYARITGSYGVVSTLTLAENTWYKIEFYLQIGTSGNYEIRVDDVAKISGSSVNLGTSSIQSIFLGGNNTNAASYCYFDDIALNDTSGSRNNSWCGSGTITGLKPKGTGNKSQWTTSQGYVIAEDGTTTTNIEITGHGLTTGDVIYNVTRNAYRQVTVVDANNLTVSSVTNQTQNDIINAFTFVSTISAVAGTTTSIIYLPNNTLESYDVIVNTSRSNAIRRVIYKVGIILTVSDTNNSDYTGLTVSSQTTGDNINTYKLKYYPIADHWKAVRNILPNPQYSNIQSSTINQIDTFDMQELVADKGLPSNTKIITAAVKAYAKEKGTGSQYQPVLRINGADYTGSTVSLIGGTLEYASIFENSPDTATQFTLSEIDSIEAGLKVV